MNTKLFCNVLAVILTFLVCSTAEVVYAQTADELVLQGKQELFENRNPVLALGKFNDALVLDASHPQAHFWHAVTVLFSDADFLTTLQSLNMMDSQYTALIFDNDGHVDYDFNRTYPDATTLQTLAVNLIPELDSALNDFSFVDTSFSDSFTIPGHSPIDIDYADAKMVEGIINLLKVVFYIYGSYDVDNADVQDVFFGEPDTGMTKWDTLLSDYPDALNLLAGHASKLLNAKSAMLNTISCYFAVSDYIRDDRLDNDGLNHLIQFYDPYDPDKFDSYQEWQEEKEENLQGEQYFRNKVVEMNNNLLDSTMYPKFELTEQDFVILEEYPETAWVNFDAFFTNPQNARSYINEIEDDMMFDDFSDTTMGGIFPDFTTADWNYAFRSNSVRIDTITVLWDEETPNGVKLWLEWYDEEPHPDFVRYKIYRSTTIDVDDSSDLVATVTDATLLTCIDDSFDTANNVYYYRVYTYYDFGAGVTSTAKSELGKVIFRVYVDAGNASDENQDGTKAHPYSELIDLSDWKEDLQMENLKILVAQGVYNHLNLHFLSGMYFEGGYESTTWTRDVDSYETKIINDSLDGIHNCHDISLDGFTVNSVDVSWVGAIHVANTSDLVVSHCKIVNNSSTGINLWQCSGVIKNCIVSLNKYQGWYSGIYAEDSSIYICDNLINSNDRGIILANYSRKGDYTVLNNTVVSNGVGIGCNSYFPDSVVTVKNNIIVGNISAISIYSSGVSTISYNNLYNNNYNWPAGQDNNISIDPMFYNDSESDPVYWLTAGSPCINVGDNDAHEYPSTDIDGYDRFADGIIDMGSYEYTDTDNDSMNNRWETLYNLNPQQNDADNDNDNDGLSNIQEYLHRTNPLNGDTDNDGLTDGWEIGNGTNALINDADADLDNDGLSNIQEFYHNTLVDDEDTDNDSLSDGWEVNNGTNPLVDDANADPDNDGLSNIDEQKYNTKPQNDDTDNDGLLDGEEILFIGSEFQINTFTTSTQSSPSVASNGLTYFVTWQSYQDGDLYGIYGQLYDNDGNKVGSEFQVNTYTTSYQANPSVASNGLTYFVTWQSYQDGDLYGIYGQLYDNDGNKVGSEFQVNTYTTSYQANPAIASNGTAYLVTWQSYQDGDLYGIYGQLYDNGGSSVGAEFQIYTYTANSQACPSVASSGNTYLVTWQNGNSRSRIYGRLYDNNANKVGLEFQVNTYTANTQKYPAIASNGTTYLVTWQSEHQDGSREGIYGQLYDSNANKIGLEFQVNTYTINDQKYPAIASNGTTYLVIWQSEHQDGSSEGIYGQLYDNDGHAISLEFKVNTYTSQNQSKPTVASNGKDYLVVWQSSNQDVNSEGIFGQLVKSFGYGTDPLNPDMDGDGLKDGEEINIYGSIANKVDSDKDGLNDGDEVYIHSTDPINIDTDNDGLPDGWEINNGTNPLQDDADGDLDNDGLNNIDELYYNTKANNCDTDNDGLFDGREVLFLGLEFQVNNYTPGRLKKPSVASSNTTYFVTWQCSSEIYGKVYDNNGKALCSEFQINSYTIESFSVASNGKTYFVAWQIYYYQGSIDDIYGQLYDDTGKALGSKFRINTYTTSEQSYPSVASSGSTYLVTWVSHGQEGYFNKIYGQLYDNDGNEIGSEFPVNYTTNSQYMPAVAGNETNYLITWQSYGQDGSYMGIYGQIYGSNGGAIGSEFRINTYTTSEQSYPSVASNGITYLVTWQSVDQDGSAYGIYGQILDNNGDKIGTEFQVNTYTSYLQKDSSVASNGSTYLVTWQSSYQDGSYYGIYGQLLDNNGDKIGTEFRVNTYTSGEQENPSVASNGTKYLLVWDSYGEFRICGQFVNASFLGTEPLNADTDGDNLKDGDEIETYGSNPTNPDTDNDGMNDGDEVYAGMEPDNADSLFGIIYCGYEPAVESVILQWQGSVSNPDMPYKIIWSDNLMSLWQEAVIDPADIINSDGIRTWLDDGDNDSSIPRPAPDGSDSRLYRVIVE